MPCEACVERRHVANARAEAKEEEQEEGEATPEMPEGEASTSRETKRSGTGVQRPSANLYLADQTAQETARGAAAETTEETKPLLPRPKYGGTVGVYVLPPDENNNVVVSVHRGAPEVRHSNTVAAP
eukprot:4463739-Pyramimonas_sp.AAC.1